MAIAENGKGFDECKTCINAEHDPFQCAKCRNGNRWEPIAEFDDDSDTKPDCDSGIISIEQGY